MKFLYIGFLPTFGPSFIHLYAYDSATSYSCTGKCSIALPIYRGRLLFSLKTEIDDPESSSVPGVEVEPAAAIIEVSIMKNSSKGITSTNKRNKSVLLL